MSKRDVHLANLRLAPVGTCQRSAAIALKMESAQSSSGVKVLSVLVNTDQKYALQNRSCTSIVVPSDGRAASLIVAHAAPSNQYWLCVWNTILETTMTKPLPVDVQCNSKNRTPYEFAPLSSSRRSTRVMLFYTNQSFSRAAQHQRSDIFPEDEAPRRPVNSGILVPLWF